MKRTYKDLRSIRRWLVRSENESSKKRTVNFFTLASLTPEGISRLIQEHYIDLKDPGMTPWMIQHYERHPGIIRKGDWDDGRLIAVILFMVDFILGSRNYNRKSYHKESGAVSISTIVLRTLHNDGRFIGHAVKVAVAAGILQIVSMASSMDKKSRTFRIHPYHLLMQENPLVVVECPDAVIAEKILAFRLDKRTRSKASDRILSNRVLLASFYNLYNLRAAYDAAVADLQARRSEELRLLGDPDQVVPSGNCDTPDKIEAKYINGLIALKKLCSDDIRDKYIRFDRNGRIHSNLTNFPKEIRPHLKFTGCGEPLAMIDMSNSQPFLMVHPIMDFLSQEHGRPIKTRRQLERLCKRTGCDDVMRYVAIVENGDFYREMYRLQKGNKRLVDITPEQKERVRRMAFTSMLFGDGSTRWTAARNLARKFQREYPTVYRVIDRHHRQTDNPNALPNRLQQEESRLFIERILKDLIVKERLPFVLSLHDGYLCNAGSVEHIIEKFRKVFANSGFQVKLKVDYYGCDEPRIFLINANGNLNSSR